MPFLELLHIHILTLNRKCAVSGGISSLPIALVMQMQCMVRNSLYLWPSHLSVQRCWKSGLGLCMLEISHEWFLQGTYSTGLDF